MRHVAISLLLLAVLFSGCAKKTNDDAAPTTTTAPRYAMPHIHAIAAGLDGQTLFVATHGGLYSLESDRVWTKVGERYDLMSLVVHPTQADTLYASGHPAAGGNAGFLKSSDGGATWTAVALAGQADFHLLAISAAKPERIWGYWAELLHRSEDGGKNWASLPPHGLGVIRGIAADPANADRVYVTHDKGIHVSTDGGLSWTLLYSAGGTGYAITTAPADAQRVYYQAATLGFARSFTQGKAFQGTGWYPDSGDVGTSATVHASVPGVVYVATEKGAVVKFVNDATEWRTIRAPGDVTA